jgi:hypothetical protein
MSKSYGNIIPLFASEKKFRKAIMKITTDSKSVDEAKDDRRLVWPGAVIWANECGHPSGWPVAMWPRAPPELDWLSIDQCTRR